MSRIGKKPIAIPKGVTVDVKDGLVTVKGPLGTLSRPFKSAIVLTIEGDTITLAPKKETLENKALWGTYGAHLKNMLEGVTKGFSKKMIIEGTGYKAQVSGKNLKLSLGYSHDIDLEIPEGIKVEVAKNEIVLTGSDKEAVGAFAAEMRDWRKPEPYKGKGVRYHDEVIERKQGKKAVA